MKCRREDMLLFNLDYGDLIRPTIRILRGRGWGQCTNQTEDSLIVYGPKHERERSIFDTSPYVLPPGTTTPDSWDCKGFLLPSDRMLHRWRWSKHGPLAIKFWEFLRFWVKGLGADTYSCPWNNGVFKPSQINWAIPDFSYEDTERGGKSLSPVDCNLTQRYTSVAFA
jgi:hypothetical protein